MKTITAEEFDRKFDNGEDIDDYVDWSRARRGVEHFEPIDVDMPLSILNSLDQVAEKLGLSREALIQRWLEQKLLEYSEASSPDQRDVAE